MRFCVQWMTNDEAGFVEYHTDLWLAQRDIDYAVERGIDVKSWVCYAVDDPGNR